MPARTETQGALRDAKIATTTIGITMEVGFVIAVTVLIVKVDVTATSIAILRTTTTTDIIATETPIGGKRITMESSRAQSIETHGMANQSANVGAAGIVAQAATAGTTKIGILMKVIMDPLAMKWTRKGLVRIAKMKVMEP